MTEAELQKLVMDAARMAGWVCYHVGRSDLAQVSDRGFPDLVLVRPPRIALVELKSEKGRVRREQRVWLDALQICDTVTSAVVRPSTADQLLDYLMRPGVPHEAAQAP